MNPVSIAHVESHPSPLILLPSSQYVEAGKAGMIFPSPQVSTQLLAVVRSPREHIHPVSTLHDESQPSSLTEFPSSQYPAVGIVTYPSPHTSIHVLADVVVPPDQVHFVSTVHEEFHPSPLEVFPSSQ